MQRSLLSLVFLWLLLTFISVSASLAQVSAVSPLMNFQGRLAKPDGTPVANGNYNLQFSLYNALTGGTLWWQRSVLNVPVRAGTFAARLDFSGGYQNSATYASLFGASALYLEISINGGAPLSPRQQFVTVAYAMKADRVKDGGITSASILDGTIATTDLANNAVTSAKIQDGTIVAADLASGMLNPLTWLIGGNSGTNPTSHFIGTTDNQPLQLRVNNRPATRYRYAENTTTTGSEYRSVNILGGSEINTIAAGVVGGTIAGGGWDSFASLDEPNQVVSNFATIGGGAGNTASDVFAGVVGGFRNTASGTFASISGGFANIASNEGSVVGGGNDNIASGQYGTIPGGYHNRAGGTYSFAAGYRAQANHDGTFVWSDGTGSNFASTAANQFLIRATGGVILSPGTSLAVGGSIASQGTDFVLSGRGGGAGNNSGAARAMVDGGPAEGLVINYANDFGWVNIGSGMTVNGGLYVTSLPFGDQRNVQWDSTTGQFYYDNSSRRHKENITPLKDDFDLLLKAVPMTYTRPNAPGRWEIGFIAEDFHDLGLKKLVDYSDKGEVEGINYEKICLYLTAIAKKQNDLLLVQQKQMDALKSEVTELRAMMQQLAEQQKAGQK